MAQGVNKFSSIVVHIPQQNRLFFRQYRSSWWYRNLHRHLLAEPTWVSLLQRGTFLAALIQKETLQSAPSSHP